MGSSVPPAELVADLWKDLVTSWIEPEAAFCLCISCLEDGIFAVGYLWAHAWKRARPNLYQKKWREAFDWQVSECALRARDRLARGVERSALKKKKDKALVALDNSSDRDLHKLYHNERPFSVMFSLGELIYNSI